MVDAPTGLNDLSGKERNALVGRLVSAIQASGLRVAHAGIRMHGASAVLAVGLVDLGKVRPPFTNFEGFRVAYERGGRPAHSRPRAVIVQLNSDGHSALRRAEDGG